MMQTNLFGKTVKDIPSDEVSINSQLLIKAGFIDKLMAGSYTYLPLGLKVLRKIEDIIREELNAIGCEELLMPAMHPKEPWEQTGRWSDPGKDVMFQFKGRGDREYGLGWTHEEIITPLAKKFITSYKDLPRALYQIQTKFRDEPRAKSGLLRGREFMMKDLYSFHANEKDFKEFYQKILETYIKIFNRVGLDSITTEASGGSFSKYSHEFQVVTPAGEDIVFVCSSCDFARNKEIAEFKENDPCPDCKKPIEVKKAIEVGNIFELKTKYTEAFDVTYKDEKGKNNAVLMGCYGIGIGRAMGAIVEVSNDKNGIIWPISVSPFEAHLIQLQEGDKVTQSAKKAYKQLKEKGVDVLYDNREGLSPGEKLKGSDLMGIPIRIVVSEKTIAQDSVEVKERASDKTKLIKTKDLIKEFIK